jgi:hypothetical protein
MDAGRIVAIAVAVVFAAIIFSIPTVEVQEKEIYFTSEPYTYEQSLVRENQVWNFSWIFPWIHEVTQVQYMVKNTDTQKGTFVLNFIFDNGTEIDTRTKTVDILAGEEKAVTMDSSLSSKSTVTLNIIPPNKSIPQERTVTKKVSVWGYLGRSVFFFFR